MSRVCRFGSSALTLSLLASFFTGGGGLFWSAALAEIAAVNDKTFKKEVNESKTPVLVDFYTKYCVPCKKMAPVLEELATEYSGKVKFVRVDADEAEKTAAFYDIEMYPYLALFLPGVKAPVVAVGYKNREQIKDFLDRSLKAPKAKAEAKSK